MRSFADALRQLEVAELTELLRRRPDLAVPTPADLGELAQRAGTETSVRRALDGLDLFRLTCCEAMAALPDPCGTEEVAALLGLDEDTVTGAIDSLRALALVWGEEGDRLHLVRPARQAFDPYPGGLAAPSPTPLPTAEIERRLAEIPEAAHAVLDRLAWGPPSGGVRNADRAINNPTTPVEHLLARGLLRAQGPDTVVLPREVALHWRGGFWRTPQPEPPAPLTAGRQGTGLITTAGVGAGFELVHEVAATVSLVEERRPQVLRDGGLSVRELQAIARQLGVDTARASFGLELARAADLLAVDVQVRPTTLFDQWSSASIPQRWQRLVDAWVRAPRLFGLAHRDGGHPLGPQAEARWAPGARARVLDQLEPGVAVDVERLSALLGWFRPRLAADQTAEIVTATVQEAGWLGLIALGQPSELVRAVGAGLPERLAERFPQPVTEVILQADLTAVAPGPLQHRVAAELHLLADQESRGGGGVHRFSATSLRRAFDLGWDSDRVLDWLGEHSRTEIPQPLRYLIADVARQHGSIRVGTASSYLRIEDPVQLAAVVNHPQAGVLGLRQVGPQTLVSAAEPDEVVQLLRELSLSPAAEDPSGAMLHPPTPPRAATPSRTPVNATPDPERLATALVSSAATARARSMTTDQTLAVLQAAMGAQVLVEVDFVDLDGRRARELLRPVELGSGMVRLVGNGRSISVPLARVRAAHTLER